MDTRVPAITTSAPERARALQPLLDQHGPEMDRRGEVTPEVVDALVQADMLRLLLPKSIGGQEMQLVEYAKTIEALGYADASVAWFINQSNVSSSTSAAAMPTETAREVFGPPSVGLAWGARHSRSKAIKVPGGYRVTGSWSFASGGRHTTWLGCHSAIQNPDGTPHTRGPIIEGKGGRADDRSFVFLRSEAKIIDDWQVLGLRATGSDSYSVEDLFIPEDQALRIEKGLFEGREPLYSSGFNWVTTMAAVPLGTARRAVDEAKALIAERTGGIPPQPLGNLPHVRESIAEAETRYGAARAFLYSAANDFWAELEGGTPAVETKGRLALANVNAFRMAAEVTRALFDLIGANVIFEGEPLERLARDALTLNQHMIIARPALATYGAMMLGHEHPSPLY